MSGQDSTYLDEREAVSIAQEIAATLPEGNALEHFAQTGEVYSDALDEAEVAYAKALDGTSSVSFLRAGDLLSHLEYLYYQD